MSREKYFREIRLPVNSGRINCRDRWRSALVLTVRLLGFKDRNFCVVYRIFGK